MGKRLYVKDGNLKITLTQLENGVHAGKWKLTYKDLDNVTVKMINHLCEKDFDLGRGYSKIEVF